MALPENFSPAEHLQDQIRRIWNRDVRAWFKDFDLDNWDPDISVPRQSLCQACIHLESDTVDMTTQRMLLFNMIKGVTVNALPIAGIPLGSVHQSRKFKPQVFLYFQEDEADIEPGYGAVTGQLTFRLMDRDDVTPSEARQLANKIRIALGGSTGHIWRKGKISATYKDRRNGFENWILCRSLADAKELISKILEIVDKTPDWSKLHESGNDQPSVAYPTIPETKHLYGETRRMPRNRPIADVRFQYAVLHIWGIQNPIPLYDRSGAWSEALERD